MSHIGGIVDRLHLLHWNGRLPVDVGGIVQACGYRLEGRPLGEISGEVCRTGDAGYRITYNSLDAPMRQRFTIAHELGHIELGHLAERDRCLRDPRENYSLDNYDPAERDANRFAALMLMPAGAVMDAIRAMDQPTLRSLADLFGVSRLAMEIRLKHMGIVPAWVPAGTR